MTSQINRKNNTFRLAGLGILTAIVMVLQLLTTYVHFGPFSITLALIPIVIGASMYGVGAGAYLGAVFSVIVIMMCAFGADPGGAMVWNANPFLCIVMCMLKGTAAGFVAGLLYKLIAKKNATLAVIVAAFASPIINTGIFIIGMLLFFKDILAQWSGGSDLLTYIIIGLTGVNFLVELGVNMVLSPVVARIISYINKQFKGVSTDQADTHVFRYAISLIVPLVGLILGAILLSKDDPEEKAAGKSCIILSLVSTAIVAFAVYVFVFL